MVPEVRAVDRGQYPPFAAATERSLAPSRPSMIGACEQTTGRRTRISRYDAENENSNGSNLPAQSNVSSPSMPPHSTHSPINVICCADRISKSFAPLHSALGLGHPPPHDACCPPNSPQLNADNVTKPVLLASRGRISSTTGNPGVEEAP